MPITVGISFYNADKFLADAIRSVFAQTYQDWELILLDDGSNDKSLEIAQSVKDSRVRVISDGVNRKLAYRLNQITNLAKHELIGRMDADDLISPLRFEKQLKILENNPNIDLVSTGVFSTSNDLKLLSIRGSKLTTTSFNEILSKKAMIVHAAILGRKSWFLRNPYNSNLKIAQDYELWLRTSSKNDLNIYLIPEPFYYYREEGNATVKKILSAYKNDRKMMKTYGGYQSVPYVLKSFFKTATIYMLNKANSTELLLKKRGNSPISIELAERYNSELIQIMSTKIPGLD